MFNMIFNPFYWQIPNVNLLHFHLSGFEKISNSQMHVNWELIYKGLIFRHNFLM